MFYAFILLSKKNRSNSNIFFNFLYQNHLYTNNICDLNGYPSKYSEDFLEIFKKEIDISSLFFNNTINYVYY